MDAVSDPKVREVVAVFASQIGKALALDTPLPTPTGWTDMGSVSVGDRLFDEQGRVCTVTLVTPIMEGRSCYRVDFQDGESIVADAEHRWPIRFSKDRVVESRGETTESISAGLSVRGRYSIPLAGPLECEKSDFAVDPYVLGVWLGDGHSYSNQITLHESDAEEICLGIRRGGYRVETARRTETGVLTLALFPDTYRPDLECTRGHIYEELGRTNRGYCAECLRQAQTWYKRRERKDPPRKRDNLQNRLRHLGILPVKAIPRAYLRASAEQRWALLQGLMDTDGYCSERGPCEFVTTSTILADGFAELLSGLSIRFTRVLKRAIAVVSATDRRRGADAWRFAFYVHRDRPLFRLQRKRERQGAFVPDHRSAKVGRRRIIAVTPVESVPVRCIRVDSPSHLYLAGKRMVPTHNTDIILNAIGARIKTNPGPMLVIQPTLEMGEAWSKDRLAPMVRDTPSLRVLVQDAKSRDSANTIRSKHFIGGHLTISGANSPAGLSMRPIRDLYCDEVDRYPVSAGTEGDPVRLASTRTRAFWNAKRIFVSSPGTKGASRLETLWNRSDQRHYFVPCPKCGTFQVPNWERVVWEKDPETGEPKPETAVYSCEHCGSGWSDIERWAAVKLGEWRASKPHTGTAGFHASALLAPWEQTRLSELVKQRIEAEGNPELLRVFHNTVLGEWWTEQFETVDETGLLARREVLPRRGDRIMVPEGAALLTMGVDVQDNRLEASVYAWGSQLESWLLLHTVLYGDPAGPALWASLEELRTSPWPRARGGVDFVRGTAIDTHGHHTQAAYDYCTPRFRSLTPDGGVSFVFAIRGAGGPGDIWPREPKLAQSKVPVYTIHVDPAKESVYGRLGIAAPGSGYAHFDIGVEHSFFLGLTAEKRVLRTNKKGFPVYVWEVKVKGRPNEQLDAAVYGLAALYGLRAMGFDLEHEVKRLPVRPIYDAPVVQAASVESVPSPEPKGRQMRGDADNSWLGDTRGWLR